MDDRICSGRTTIQFPLWLLVGKRSLVENSSTGGKETSFVVSKGIGGTRYLLLFTEGFLALQFAQLSGIQENVVALAMRDRDHTRATYAMFPEEVTHVVLDPTGLLDGVQGQVKTMTEFVSAINKT